MLSGMCNCPVDYCRQPLTNRQSGIIILEMAGRFSLPAAAGPVLRPVPLRQILGISPVVGRLTLDQEAEVRALHPQPPLPPLILQLRRVARSRFWPDYRR